MQQRISCLHSVTVCTAKPWNDCGACSHHRMYCFLAPNKPTVLDFEGHNILLSCWISWVKHKWMRQRRVPRYGIGHSSGVSWIWKWSRWSNMLLT